MMHMYPGRGAGALVYGSLREHSIFYVKKKLLRCADACVVVGSTTQHVCTELTIRDARTASLGFYLPPQLASHAVLTFTFTRKRSTAKNSPKSSNMSL